MSENVGAMGGNMGETFDDGVFDGVKQITVGEDFHSVSYIKIEYEKDGNFETREHGTIQKHGKLEEFTVDYPNEYITSVGGGYERDPTYKTVLIKSLIFKTSYGRTSPILGHKTLFGKPAGKEFMLEGENGGKLLGFHGRSGDALDAIGAHFFAVNSPLEHFKPQGGNGGSAWDDGAFDGVRKVLVGRHGKSVSYVRFEYAKGERMVPHSHGKIQEAPQEFLVDYPNEHITLVEGTIDRYLSSLTFKTSKGRTSAFGNVVGRRFVFEQKDFKLVGFCGRSGDAIDALGAHFAPLPAPVPAPPAPAPPSTNGTGSNTGGSGLDTGSSGGPQKLEPQGGEGGNQWDDGADHDGVTKIHVAPGGQGIEQIRFDYVKNGETKEGAFHGGEASGFPSTIDISYPDEYLVSVEGWYDSSNTIQGIKFKTNKKTTDIFGYQYSGDGTQFSLQVKDKKIVGFHGFVDSRLHSLGAYFTTISATTSTPLSLSFKLPAKGGNGGVSWDDGVHDNVSKVYIGKSDSGVTSVKFEYYNESNLQGGDCHGNKSSAGTEEFVVGPDDYITSVKVYYKKVITALIFKTLKGITSQLFGKISDDIFLLEGGKIIGFHGSSSDVLHSIGAYISLSSTPMLRGKWIQVEQKGKGPEPRCSHAIAMVGDKMYSFGGELTPNIPIDKHLYVFDFKTHTWSLAPPNGDVPDLTCLGVCMVAIGTTVYVFGGRDGHRHRKYSGFYSYDTVKSEWKLITHVDKGPAPRSFHSMAADDKNVYVFGGVTAKPRVNTLHAYNIVDQKWTELPNPGESCKARGGAGLAVVQGKIWVVYGFSGDEMDDVHCFDPAESKWTKVETKGEKPWPRSVFAIAAVGKYIVMSGGEIAMDPEAHMGPGKLTGGAFVLDTESFLWEKLEEGHSPRGWCPSTTASIDGKKGLLIHGGKAPTNGRYEDLFFYGVDSA